MPKLKLEQLRALGEQRLAELLLDLADQDRTVERKLLLATASEADRLKQVRSQISGLKRIKRFHDWKSVRNLKQKIDEVLSGIEQVTTDPKSGFQLVCSFYETDNAVFEHCDDSSGLISDLYRYDAHRLLIHWGRQCDDERWLAEQVVELNQQNDYGVRDNVLAAACEFLSEPVVRKLIAQYCERAAAADEATGDQVDGWNRPSRRDWGAAQALAQGIKDAPLFEMTLLSAWGRHEVNSSAWNKIAQVYLDAGDPQTALERLDKIDGQDRFKASETEQLRLAAHAALGGEGSTREITRILRDRLWASPSSATLCELSKHLTPPERQAVVDELVSRYVTTPSLDLSFLEFSLQELDLSAAESYLLERVDQIDGDRYHALAPLARQFAERGSPLAATLILRALAESILARGVSKNYKIAVSYVNRAEQLAEQISDWQSHPRHETYLERLRADHARKTAFWSKMT